MTSASPPVDEFQRIRDLLAPLSFGAPEALGLLDDAALLTPREGRQLVLTKDAIVEGVHFLEGARTLAGRRLLRCNLSDLAAKAAEPDACLLAVGFPPAWREEARAAFAGGLGEDLERYKVRLIGGDTVSTPGPFWASLTALGWTRPGAFVARRGARPGDGLFVSGTIGDAGLGLLSLTGGLVELSPEDRKALEERHLLPEPRLELTATLERFARAAADVSDGLLADADHLAAPFSLGLEIRLEDLPLSPAAARWVAAAPEPEGALRDLASSGDDYEIVLAVAPADAASAAEEAAGAGLRLTQIGVFTHRPGLRVFHRGRELEPGRQGWTHP